MKIEFKNPVATVLVVWAVERTVKHIVTSLTMPEFDKAMCLIKSKGYDIIPKEEKKEESEDLEKIDPDVVEDLPDEIDISSLEDEEKEEK